MHAHYLLYKCMHECMQMYAYNVCACHAAVDAINDLEYFPY